MIIFTCEMMPTTISGPKYDKKKMSVEEKAHH